MLTAAVLAEGESMKVNRLFEHPPSALFFLYTR